MKKKKILAMLLACSFVLGTASMTACNLIGGNGENEEQEQHQPQTVAVTGVSLDETTVNLKIGNQKKLNATVAPSDATNKSVIWVSSNPDVASVDVYGNITAKAKGTATITVTTASGSKTATCTVNVSGNESGTPPEENPGITPGVQPEVVHVQSVKLNKNSVTLKVDGTEKLTVSFTPANPDNKKVSWASDKTNIATVSAEGLITAKAVGTATITVTSEDGSHTDTCTVTVEAKSNPLPSVVNVTGVTLNTTSATLKPDETVTLKETVSPADANNKAVTWQSGNTAVATVSNNGVVTAVAAGQATITVKTDDGNFTATCAITVQQPAIKPVDPVVDKKITYSYAGNECAAFEWGDTNAAGADVEYKLSTASTYTKLSGDDKKFLIRQVNSTTARVDLVGLKGGAVYDFKITTSAKEILTAEDVTIHAYDRSGYAHFKKTDGVGAYKDDGTVKSNAKVYYVTENNKNNIDGKSTSLAELLENSSNGTAASLNNSAPIVIRVIGTVKCPQYLSANNLDSSIPDIDGITRTDQGNDSYWNMIDIKDGSNITVEGIGEDATIFQFGFTWKKCSSIEVRNLTFTDYPEDACSFEGDTKSPSSCKYIWLHHSVFNIGKNGWDKTDEQDKHDGDGATDLKGVSNVTFSYLRYNSCHKTGLVGGDDTHLTSNVTFHHNYYNGNQQRLPLGRQANMHMYNNYYYKSTMYSISLRANAYAFIENNYFDNSNGKGTIEIRNSSKVANYGYGKLYNNKFADENNKGFQKYADGKMSVFDGGNYIVEVSSRTQNVANTNSFNQNFDTDSSAFYYDATNQKSDVSVMFTAEDTKTYVPQLAGVQQRGGDVTLGGSGSGGTGTETPNPNPNPNPGDETGETQTIVVISDFSAANKAKNYTLSPSAETAKYFDSTKFYLYVDTDDTSKSVSATGNYLKLESATKIKFVTTNQLPEGAKIVLTMGDMTGVEANRFPTAVKVNGIDINIADNKVTFDLASGTEYIIGRAGGETRIASISIIIPA